MTDAVQMSGNLVLSRKVGESIILRTKDGEHIATVTLRSTSGRRVQLSVRAALDVRVDRTEKAKETTMRLLVIYDSNDHIVGTYDFERGYLSVAPGADEERASALLPDALKFATARTFAHAGVRINADGTAEEVDIDGAELGNVPQLEAEPEPEARTPVSTPDLLPKRYPK